MVKGDAASVGAKAGGCKAPVAFEGGACGAAWHPLARDVSRRDALRNPLRRYDRAKSIAGSMTRLCASLRRLREVRSRREGCSTYRSAALSGCHLPPPV